LRAKEERPKREGDRKSEGGGGGGKEGAVGRSGGARGWDMGLV
jgi:hypothetical protein